MKKNAIYKNNNNYAYDDLIKAGLVFIAFMAAFLAPDKYATILKDSFVSAYLSVSVFVAATLFLIYGAGFFLKFDIAKFGQGRPKAQVIMATVLGALPGCGGAIIVLTQFVKGQISFGSVIAVLVATMGDAAFLLIASEPKTAALVLSVSALAGIVTGYIVDAMHGPDFLRPILSQKEIGKTHQFKIEKKVTWMHMAALVVMVPGVVLGGLMAFQYEVPEKLEVIVGICGAFTMLAIWVMLKGKSPVSNYTSANDKRSFVKHCLDDTAFVSVWVVVAFVLFEFCVQVLGLDLKSLLAAAGVFLPLMAVLVGFIPGCGPQIIVTTLYINGLIPLSAQVANAISNDGDALFPAIAIAPKAAIFATLYSGLPAVLIGYVFYFTVG